jgi:hypothetical protein
MKKIFKYTIVIILLVILSCLFLKQLFGVYFLADIQLEKNLTLLLQLIVEVSVLIFAFIAKPVKN